MRDLQPAFVLVSQRTFANAAFVSRARAGWALALGLCIPRRQLQRSLPRCFLLALAELCLAMHTSRSDRDDART